MQSVPGGFEKFDHIFEPCNELQYVLLNWRSPRWLDRIFEEYVFGFSFWDEDEEQYHSIVQKWKPSDCLSPKVPENQLSLFNH